MALYKHKKESQVRKERDFLYSIIENMEGNGIIFIKSNSKLVKLKTSDIFFIEALKDYVTINTKTARYTIHSTMKDIQAKLPQNEFIRVHRSFIVRVDKIGSIDFPNLVLEEDKKVIPIGGSYKEELYQKLKLI
jgi:DNA-binding LytR/AlgR family response regulator